MSGEIEVCADVMARYEEQLVLVERLTEPEGLALPGGRLEPGESLAECAAREFHEETGLHLELEEQFRTYSAPDRDPRGHKISTVYTGEAYGWPQQEEGKTEIVLTNPAEIPELSERFVFDHETIVADVLSDGFMQAAEEDGSGTGTEGDTYFLAYDRDMEAEQESSYDYEQYGRKLFDQYREFDTLLEAQRARGRAADCMLAGLPPATGPEYVDDSYVVIAEHDGKFVCNHLAGYDNLTTYDAVQCSRDELDDVVALLSAENPNRLRVGAEVGW